MKMLSMNCCFCLCVVLGAVVGHGDEPNAKQLAIADELMANFVAHRDTLDRFAVTGRIQVVNEGNAANIEERWCIACMDAEKDIRRFDEIRWHLTSTGLVKAREFTVLYDGKMVTPMLDYRESEKSFDLQAAQEEGKEKFFSFPIIRLSPFEHMFNSGVIGVPAAARPPSILSRLSSGSYDVTEFKQTPEVYVVRYLWHPVRGIEIAYDRTQDDLPVRIDYVDLPNSRVIYSSSTAWGRYKDKWLPKQITVSSLLDKRKSETTIDLRWVLGRNFPEKVFAARNGLTSTEIRDLVEEHAIALQSK